MIKKLYESLKKQSKSAVDKKCAKNCAWLKIATTGSQMWEKELKKKIGRER